MASIKWSEAIPATALMEETIVPDGDYDVEVIHALFKPTGKGDPMWKIKTSIIDGPYKGKIIWENIAFVQTSEGSVRMFWNKMRVLGLTKEWFMNDPSDDEVCAAIKGARFTGSVVSEEWQGKTSNKFKTMRVLEAAPPVGLPVPPGDLPF